MKKESKIRVPPESSELVAMRAYICVCACVYIHAYVYMMFRYIHTSIAWIRIFWFFLYEELPPWLTCIHAYIHIYIYELTNFLHGGSFL